MTWIIKILKSPTSWHELSAILALRLIALCGFLIVLSTVLTGDNTAFYALMGFSFIITIPYSLWLRKQELCKQFAALQFTVDLITVSGLIYFTGGLNSELNILYPLVILSAGIVATPKQTIQITLLSVVIYCVLIRLVTINALPPVLGEPCQLTQIEVFKTVSIRIIIFLFFGMASAYLSQRCNFINKKEEKFRGMTEIIFSNIHTGLFLLDSNKNILLTNPRACTILGRSQQEICKLNLRDLLDASGHSNDPIRPLAYFKGKGSNPFPCAYEISSLVLPAEAIPHFDGKADNDVEVQILSFKDVSLMVDLQEQIEQAGRMQAAADMAAEVAHEIRTPLTAISGAVQLLDYLDKDAKQKSDDMRNSEKKDLLKQIFQQSARIDKVIQHFLDYSEFSQADLAQLMDMNLSKNDKLI